MLSSVIRQNGCMTGYANKYGGRVIGTFSQEARLRDGKLYDVKYYEMMRDKCLRLLETEGADKYRLILGGDKQ